MINTKLLFAATGAQKMTLTYSTTMETKTQGDLVMLQHQLSVNVITYCHQTAPSFCAGHIGIYVPNVYKACERFESLGVNFVKKPDDGTCLIYNF